MQLSLRKRLVLGRSHIEHHHLVRQQAVPDAHSQELYDQSPPLRRYAWLSSNLQNLETLLVPKRDLDWNHIHKAGSSVCISYTQACRPNSVSSRHGIGSRNDRSYYASHQLGLGA